MLKLIAVWGLVCSVVEALPRLDCKTAVAGLVCNISTSELRNLDEDLGRCRRLLIFDLGELFQRGLTRRWAHIILCKDSWNFSVTNPAASSFWVSSANFPAFWGSIVVVACIVSVWLLFCNNSSWSVFVNSCSLGPILSTVSSTCDEPLTGDADVSLLFLRLKSSSAVQFVRCSDSIFCGCPSWLISMAETSQPLTSSSLTSWLSFSDDEATGLVPRSSITEVCSTSVSSDM